MCKIFWGKLKNQEKLDKAQKLFFGFQKKSVFTYILSSSAKNLPLQKRLGTRFCPNSTLCFFLNKMKLL